MLPVYVEAVVVLCVCFVCVLTQHHPLWMLEDKPIASHQPGPLLSIGLFFPVGISSCDTPSGGSQATQRAREAGSATQQGLV